MSLTPYYIEENARELFWRRLKGEKVSTSVTLIVGSKRRV